MAKFNRSMQEFIQNQRVRDKQKQVKREEIGEYCRQYINTHKQFDWFIEKYYGKQKVVELWELAEQNQEEHLKNALNGIWFDLPDHIFNIRTNPPGWEAFLRLVEE